MFVDTETFRDEWGSPPGLSSYLAQFGNLEERRKCLYSRAIYVDYIYYNYRGGKINFRITTKRAYGEKYSVMFYALKANPTFNTEWQLGEKTKYLLRKRTIGV